MQQFMFVKSAFALIKVKLYNNHGPVKGPHLPALMPGAD
jgi:hypothetical protein